MTRTIHIVQGEQATGSGEETVISTLLGSCVAACLWDDVAKVGGMNHMLLPGNTGGSAACNLSSVNAMELLINALIKSGAVRSRLQAKAFGGASMVSGLSDIGGQNAKFTLEFLANEGIAVAGHSLGGHQARTIRFWPGSGRVIQRLAGRSAAPQRPEVVKPTGNGLELL